jgi:glycosyltransferase involved in cell wall biosynthesis
MRVLYITGSLDRGGAEQQLYYLLKYSQPRPEATVVSLEGEGYWQQPLIDLGVRVIPLQRRGAADVARLLNLTRVIRTGGYDIVHLFIDNVQGIYAHLAAFASGHPRFITGERADIYSQPSWYRSFKRIANRRVKRVLCNSAAAAESLVRERIATAQQVHYIPNGIELARFTLPRSLADAPVIGMIGSLRSVKNPELFVRAAAKVIESQPTTRFIHVGDGPLLPDMRRLAAELEIDGALTFYGLREDVAPILAQMDVFVLTSNSEGMPNAVMEAMATGLPCVTTDVGDCRELIAEGENGFRVPVGDVNTLASALLKLSSDPALRDRMGRASAARIQAYDVHRMAQRYQTIYDDVLSAK